MTRPTSLFRFDNEYQDALNFIQSNPEIRFEDFDDYALYSLRLFDVPKEHAIEQINGYIDAIIKALPAIKRIFAKPIIHLKDVDELLPVENVRKITNYTISHATIHSELWSDITKDGIKPKKLMTLDRTENYTIYENIVFTFAVDMILSFVRKTLGMLNDIMYSCRDLYFNMLDRTHHSLYFLAIGKLHVEYVHAQNERRNLYAECIDKLLFIDKTIRAKLSSPVYKHCKGVKNKLTLKKTNTFRSHKDYKQVYKLLKLLCNDVDEMSAWENSDSSEYSAYCVLLSLFAAEHFNFEMPSGSKIDLKDLNAEFELCDWKFNIREGEYNGIRYLDYIFSKESEYHVCLITTDAEYISSLSLDAFKGNVAADEYFFLSPEAYGKRETLYLSIYDVDSFRRLQQIMLRGLIYSDKTRDVCPFCKNRLVKADDRHECPVCRAVISENTCSVTGESYFVSEIKKYKIEDGEMYGYIGNNRFLHDRLSEARLHFRNITPITQDGKPICPKCGMIH